PVPVEIQVATLWMVQNGYVDDIPVERIKQFQARLTEHLSTSGDNLLTQIGSRKALDEALVAKLKQTAEKFKTLWYWRWRAHASCGSGFDRSAARRRSPRRCRWSRRRRCARRSRPRSTCARSSGCSIASSAWRRRASSTSPIIFCRRDRSSGAP